MSDLDGPVLPILRKAFLIGTPVVIVFAALLVWASWVIMFVCAVGLTAMMALVVGLFVMNALEAWNESRRHDD
jgi:Na+(H+)/acetate symporter ActP